MTHRAGPPSWLRHWARLVPSNSTTASGGAATGSDWGAGATTGGRGRVMSWAFQRSGDWAGAGRATAASRTHAPRTTDAVFMALLRDPPCGGEDVRRPASL